MNEKNLGHTSEQPRQDKYVLCVTDVHTGHAMVRVFDNRDKTRPPQRHFRSSLRHIAVGGGWGWEGAESEANLLYKTR